MYAKIHYSPAKGGVHLHPYPPESATDKALWPRDFFCLNCTVDLFSHQKWNVFFYSTSLWLAKTGRQPYMECFSTHNCFCSGLSAVTLPQICYKCIYGYIHVHVPDVTVHFNTEFWNAREFIACTNGRYQALCCCSSCFPDSIGNKATHHAQHRTIFCAVYPVPTSGGDVGYESPLTFKGGRGRNVGISFPLSNPAAILM